MEKRVSLIWRGLQVRLNSGICRQISDFGRLPIARRLVLPLFAALLLWPGLARAAEKKTAGQETVDTEHIFGFTEGADIGEKGEAEFENSAVVRFGKMGT
jgi:hypothetical protein